MLAPLPHSFSTTRHALHQLAEHVLSAIRHAATGRISLRPSPDGIVTPSFGPDNRVVGVVGSQAFDRTDAGQRRADITSIGQAAAFFGITAGAPRQVFTPTTELHLDIELAIDAEAVTALAAWYCFGSAAFEALATRSEQVFAEAQVWPEHFDLGTNANEVNYGASPGDEAISEPYLYVGPWDVSYLAETNNFWNAPFGATMRYSEIVDLDQAIEFLWTGHEVARHANRSGRTESP